MYKWIYGRWNSGQDERKPQNEDSRIEGSFTMDNLQAVSEELARFNAMLIAPLQDELAAQGSDMGTSGNENIM